jgi:DNA-binding response OmpR family regulator
MDKIKVLIADDEQDILEIMARKIVQEGFDVTTAPDGLVAWEKVKTEAPDVLVLDLTMPNMSGWEVLEQLRANPPHQKWIPVIIVSALGEVKDMERGMALQADHYLIKPCSIEAILKGIRLMLALLPQRKAESEA